MGAIGPATGPEAIDGLAAELPLFPRVSLNNYARRLRERRRDYWPESRPGGAHKESPPQARHYFNLLASLGALQANDGAAAADALRALPYRHTTMEARRPLSAAGDTPTAVSHTWQQPRRMGETVEARVVAEIMAYTDARNRHNAAAKYDSFAEIVLCLDPPEVTFVVPPPSGNPFEWGVVDHYGSSDAQPWPRPATARRLLVLPYRVLLTAGELLADPSEPPRPPMPGDVVMPTDLPMRAPAGGRRGRSPYSPSGTADLAAGSGREAPGNQGAANTPPPAPAGDQSRRSGTEAPHSPEASPRVSETQPDAGRRSVEPPGQSDQDDEDPDGAR
jgi:hypothetical protein